MESTRALSLRPSTTSLLEQKAAQAKTALTTPTTSPSVALKAAKQLVGCFPHARPPEPETYAAALGATLAQYPPAIVAECVDPRVGLARTREFPPTVAAIVEWCDARLRYYESLSKYQAREQKPEPVFTDEDRARAKRFLADLAAELKERNTVAALVGEPRRRREDRMASAKMIGAEADALAEKAAAE